MNVRRTYIRRNPFALCINEGGCGVTFAIIPHWGLYFRLYVAGVVFSISRRRFISVAGLPESPPVEAESVVLDVLSHQ